MPKRLRSQRRGKGKLCFSSNNFHFKSASCYRVIDDKERTDKIEGKIIDFIDDPARTTPTMVVKYVDGSKMTVPAPYGVRVGDVVYAGLTAPVKEGNILPLKSIPTGAVIYNIEKSPGDGGKFVRASGVSARIVSKEFGEVTVKLPSKEFKKLNEDCRATIGIAAGFGRKELPIVKAGKHFFMKRATGKYWPNVSGVAMNAINHPHGGKRRSTQHTKNKSVSRRAPPGAKVGSISPRRTGRVKRV